MNIDPKKLKYLKSDDKSTTLQHKDGHVLTIAHKALSPKMQEQLKSMAPKQEETPEKSNNKATQTKRFDEGGSVEVTPIQSDSGVKAPPAAPAKSGPDLAALAKLAPMLAAKDGGMIPRYADGTTNVGSQLTQGVVGIDPNAKAPDLQELQDNDLKAHITNEAKGYLATTTDAEDPDEAWQHASPEMKTEALNQSMVELAAKKVTHDRLASEDKQEEAEKNATEQTQVANAAQILGIAPGTVPPAPDAQQPQVAVAPQPGTDPTAAGGNQASPSGLGGPYGEAEAVYRKGMGQYQAGLAKEAGEQGKLGEEQAGLHQDAAKAIRIATDTYDQNFQNAQQEMNNTIEDIKNGHISPDKYWTGVKDPATGKIEGSHSKIATGIGMILAGFNPTGNPNAAINFLNNQMEMNLRAQTANMGAKQSLLTANMQMFGNYRDAAEFTRVQQNAIIAHDLDKAASMAKGPLAAAAAQQAAGIFNTKAAEGLKSFAMFRTMSQLGQNVATHPGGEAAWQHANRMMELFNPKMAEMDRQRHVPGVGDASIPVPDSAKQQIATHKSVNDLMNMSLEFSRQHAGTWSPTLRAQAKTIQDQLIGQIKQAQHDGVYKPSEAEFLLDQIGGSPASAFAKLSSVPKIKQLQAIKQSEYNQLLGVYGFPQQQLPGAAQGSNNAQAMAWAKANLHKDPRAAKILQKLSGK